MSAAAVVQEVQGSLLLPQQDFLHSPQGVAADVEVEAVGNDVDDVDDDVVNLPHPHSQTLTVTSEGSLTSVLCWLVLAQTAGDPQTAAVRPSAFALQVILTGLGYEPTADAASVVLLISACLLGHPPFQKNPDDHSE